MLETILTTLIVGVSFDASQMPTPNMPLVLPDKQACVSAAKALTDSFEENYPTGTLIAVCKDTQGQTFYVRKNNRQYPVGGC